MPGDVLSIEGLDGILRLAHECSHCTCCSSGRDLDLPDILYAARLAAANSKARGSSNVPVDYTRIKHVWKPRGAPAGQVHYTDQKTVFVDGTLPE